MFRDRRQHERKPLTVAVTMDFNGTTVRASECRDISIGGMLIALWEDIAENRQGVVTLTTKCGSEFISFSAVFKIVRECFFDEQNQIRGVGVEFIGMDAVSSHNLHRIVTYCI